MQVDLLQCGLGWLQYMIIRDYLKVSTSRRDDANFPVGDLQNPIKFAHMSGHDNCIDNLSLLPHSRCYYPM